MDTDQSYVIRSEPPLTSTLLLSPVAKVICWTGKWNRSAFLLGPCVYDFDITFQEIQGPELRCLLMYPVERNLPFWTPVLKILWFSILRYPAINTYPWEPIPTMASGQASELQSVIALIKTLTNAQLKDILRVEGLAVSGVKASLQMRIINYLEQLIQSGRLESYDSLRKFIYATAHRSLPQSPSVPPPVAGHHYQHSPANQVIQSHHRPSPIGMSMPLQGSASGTILCYICWVWFLMIL